MFLIRWRRSSFDFSEYGRIPWLPLLPLGQVFEEPPEATEGIEAEEFVEVTEEARGHGRFSVATWSWFIQLPGAITLSLPSRHRNLSPMSFLFSFPVNGGICDPSSLPGAGGNFSFWWFRIHLDLLMDLLVFWKICFDDFLGIPPASPWDLLNSCWFPGIYMSTKFPGFLGPIFFGSVDLLLIREGSQWSGGDFSLHLLGRCEGSTFRVGTGGGRFGWGKMWEDWRWENVGLPPTNSLGKNNPPKAQGLCNAVCLSIHLGVVFMY